MSSPRDDNSEAAPEPVPRTKVISKLFKAVAEITGRGCKSAITSTSPDTQRSIELSVDPNADSASESCRFRLHALAGVLKNCNATEVSIGCEFLPSKNDELGALIVEVTHNGPSVLHGELQYFVARACSGEPIRDYGFGCLFAAHPKAVFVDAGDDEQCWRIHFKEDLTSDIFALKSRVEGTVIRIILEADSANAKRTAESLRRDIEAYASPAHVIYYKDNQDSRGIQSGAPVVERQDTTPVTPDNGKDKRALEIVDSYVTMAGVAMVVIPVPGADMTATFAVWGKMIAELASVYGHTVTLEDAKSLASDLFKSVIMTTMAWFGSAKLASTVLKFIPGAGTVTAYMVDAVIAAFGSAKITRALGLAARKVLKKSL